MTKRKQAAVKDWHRAAERREFEGTPWSPMVEVLRTEMMKRFSNQLSMEEIAEFSYAVASCQPDLSEDEVRREFESWASMANGYPFPLSLKRSTHNPNIYWYKDTELAWTTWRTAWLARSRREAK